MLIRHSIPFLWQLGIRGAKAVLRTACFDLAYCSVFAIKALRYGQTEGRTHTHNYMIDVIIFMEDHIP